MRAAARAYLLAPFLIALFALPVLAASVEGPAQPSAVEVQAHGARGDGVADDTDAFRKALREGARLRLPVHVGPGRYRLTATLDLENVTLTGDAAGAWAADVCPLPVLLPAHSSGPLLRLRAGGAVSGVQIVYGPSEAERKVAAPAIELAGVGVRVSACRIQGAWSAIAWDGKSNTGRAQLHDLLIVDAHHEGVSIGGSWDAAQLRNVHVWSPGSKSFATEGVGFRLLKNDALRLTDCFVYNAQTGYLFQETRDGEHAGVTWGSLTNCQADYCSVDLDVRGAHIVTITGGTYWSHFGALKVSGDGAQVMVTGTDLGANGAPAVEIAGGETVTIVGSQVRRLMEKFSAPAVRIIGGRSVALTGNVIRARDAALRVEPGVRAVVATGNVLESQARRAVEAVGRIRPAWVLGPNATAPKAL